MRLLKREGLALIRLYIKNMNDIELIQVRLWEWRDTVQDIWEDPAIQVLATSALSYSGYFVFGVFGGSRYYLILLSSIWSIWY